MGDFNLQKLPSRRLQTLWEQKNRVLLEEYYIFNVAIPLEVLADRTIVEPFVASGRVAITAPVPFDARNGRAYFLTEDCAATANEAEAWSTWVAVGFRRLSTNRVATWWSNVAAPPFLGSR